jgi:hypothetical protein
MFAAESAIVVFNFGKLLSLVKPEIARIRGRLQLNPSSDLRGPSAWIRDRAHPYEFVFPPKIRKFHSLSKLPQ